MSDSSIRLQIRLKKIYNQTTVPRFGDDDYVDDFSPLTFQKQFKRIAPGQIVIGATDGYLFKNDISQYNAMYKKTVHNQFSLQLRCLDQLFKYLKQQNIAVSAIEMPLTNAAHI